MSSALRPLQALPVRPTLLALCLSLSLAAQAAPVQLDLPAQPLAQSLSQLAQQAQVQLLFDEALLSGARAPALRGAFEPQDAIARLLAGSRFALVRVGESATDSRSGRRTSGVRPWTRSRSNIPSVIATLPGVNMGGSAKPGGQTINIWGLGDAEDVPMTVDGATKSGFERYQQGTVFIEPELIKHIEVEKGPHSVKTGNGGFGGSVNMTTKDAGDLLQDGRNSGAMLKYGYASNDHQQVYSSALFGRSDDGRVDGLAYLTKRDGGDMKLASNLPDPDEQRAGPGRRTVQGQPALERRTQPGLFLVAFAERTLGAVLLHGLSDTAERRQYQPLRLRRRTDPLPGQPHHHRHHMVEHLHLSAVE